MGEKKNFVKIARRRRLNRGENEKVYILLSPQLKENIKAGSQPKREARAKEVT